MDSTLASGPANLDATALYGRLRNLAEDAQVEAVAKEFEALVFRQYLQDALKPVIQGALGSESVPGSGIYQHYLVDAMATAITEGGEFGFSNVLQSQLQESGLAKGDMGR